MPKNCILYTRVSTQDQFDNGYSIRHQQATLEAYCDTKGYNVLTTFEEDCSGKDFNRPEYNKLISYIKINKKLVDAILITKFDRFGRNIEESYKQIRVLKNYGVEIIAIEQPLDLSNPNTKILLSLYLSFPEVERDIISARTRAGMNRAAQEGAFMGAKPFGYLYDRTIDGKATLKPDLEIQPIILKAFEMYATGVFSSEEIRTKFYSQGLKINKQSFLNMLKNPVYIGKIVVSEWQKQDKKLVDGLHPAIVPESVFNQVQRVLAGKRVPTIRKTSIIDEKLPLRGFLKCHCGKSLTGSASKGGSGISHFYYHCNPPCKYRYRNFEIHNLLLNMLSEFEINQDAKEMYKKILNQTFQNNAIERTVRINTINKQLTILENRLESIENKFIDDEIESKTYYKLKSKTEQGIGELKMELSGLTTVKKDLEVHLKNGISFLNNIQSVYDQSSVEIKRKILSAIFPEKLSIENNLFTTPKIDKYISYILSQKELKYLKIGEELVK